VVATRTISLVILTLFLTVIISINCAYAYDYELSEALDYGYIKAEIYGTGDYYGSGTIYVYLENTRDYTITVIIPQGQFLVPDDEKYQTMVVAKTYEITLKPEDSESLYIAAFCAEIDDDVPTPYTTFDVGSKASYDLMSVLKTIEKKGLINDIEAQLAVWTVTDGPYKVKEKLQKAAKEEGVSESEVNEVLKDVQSILDDAGLGNRYKLIEKGLPGFEAISAILAMVVLIARR